MQTFTLEQEARIAEIVGLVMRGVSVAAPAVRQESRAPVAAPWCDLPEEAIAERYRLGENAITLGSEFGVSSETIYRIARAHGVAGGKRPRGPRGRHVDKYAAIAAAYDGGKTLLECAAEFKVGVQVIYKELDAYNIEVRAQGIRRARGKDRRIERIMAMRSDGATGEDIGIALGITRERVRQIVAKAGLSEQFGESAPLSPQQKAILQEYADGATLYEIASKLGVGVVTAKRWLPRAGIKVRPSTYRTARVGGMRAKAEQIAKRYLEGGSPQAIAEEFGLKKAPQIYRYLAVAGVKPTRKPGAGRVALKNAA